MNGGTSNTAKGVGREEGETGGKIRTGREREREGKREREGFAYCIGRNTHGSTSSITGQGVGREDMRNRSELGEEGKEREGRGRKEENLLTVYSGRLPIFKAPLEC